METVERGSILTKKEDEVMQTGVKHLSSEVMQTRVKHLRLSSGIYLLIKDLTANMGNSEDQKE